MRHAAITSALLAALTTAGVDAQAAGAWTSESLAGLDVWIYTPVTTSPHGHRALMVNLHGCTQTRDMLKELGHWEPAADDYGLVVAIPQVPGGGVYLGCWDYAGGNHTRTSRHVGPVLDLVAALLGDAGRDLDPRQVYVSGLSSGASQSMVLACIAPDVFAGVGIAAGAAVGTAMWQAAYVAASASGARSTCNDLAATNTAHFKTQLASIVHDPADPIVDGGYGPVIADVFSGLYGPAASPLTTSALTVTALAGFEPAGVGTLHSDATGPRVSFIAPTGLGHAWPAGSGDGATQDYVAKRGVDYPRYLAELFTTHNRRVGTSGPGDDGGPDDDGATDSDENGDGDGDTDSHGDAPSDASADADAGTSGEAGGDSYTAADETDGLHASGCAATSTTAWLVLACIGLLATRARDLSRLVPTKPR